MHMTEAVRLSLPKSAMKRNAFTPVVAKVGNEMKFGEKILTIR